MVTFVLKKEDTFAVGVTVTVYPKANWATWQLPPVGSPAGSSTTSAVVQSDGTATFTGLADATNYFAYAASPDRYVSFRTAVVANSAAVDPPDVFQIPVFGQPTANVNWTTFVQSNTQWGAGSNTSSGAQNDEATWQFTCRAGTYSIALFARGSTNFGIATIRIDGATVGTMDQYLGVAANIRTVLTGVVLAAGSHLLNAKMETKNASSSSFFGSFAAIVFTRTGA